jgi:hypothetical protein
MLVGTRVLGHLRGVIREIYNPAPGQGNCMQQAGVEESVIEQISLCRARHLFGDRQRLLNTSLTPRETATEVHEIREKAMQNREGLPLQISRNLWRRGSRRATEIIPAAVIVDSMKGMGGCGEVPRNERPGNSQQRRTEQRNQRSSVEPFFAAELSCGEDFRAQEFSKLTRAHLSAACASN